MTNQADVFQKNTRRKEIWLLALTGIVVLFLAATVSVLYFGQLGDSHLPAYPIPETRGTLLFGGLGLVVLFTLYVIFFRIPTLANARFGFIKHNHHEQILHRNFSEISYLFDVASQVASKRLDLSAVLQSTVQRALNCLEADSCSIMLIDKVTKQLRVRAAAGRDAETVRGGYSEVGQGVAGWVVRNNSLLELDNKEMRKRFPSQLKRTRKLSKSICVPLNRGNEVVGVLNVNRMDTQRGFYENEIKLTRIFATQIATTILNSDEFLQDVDAIQSGNPKQLARD